MNRECLSQDKMNHFYFVLLDFCIKVKMVFHGLNSLFI